MLPSTHIPQLNLATEQAHHNQVKPYLPLKPLPEIRMAHIQQLEQKITLPLLHETTQSLTAANDSNKVPFLEALKDRGVILPKITDCRIAISSGALFNYTEDHEIKYSKTPEEYQAYQLAHENHILDKGMAFSLAEKIFNVNKKLKAIGSELQMDIIIASKNTPESAFRTMNSAEHYSLPIIRGAFSGGNQPYGYAKAMNACLFLTTNAEDAKQAIQSNLPAALLVDSCQDHQMNDQLKLSFDADAVIVSDDSERVAQEKGLFPFYVNESNKRNEPMAEGPLCRFIKKLSDINKEFPAGEQPIRITITTARAIPAITRLQNTLKAWDIKVDEIQFLGGIPKGEVLKAFQADLFFDDSPNNIESGKNHVQSGHVIYGINNP